MYIVIDVVGSAVSTDIFSTKPRSSMIKDANIVIYVPKKGDVRVLKSNKSFTFDKKWRA